MCFVLGAAAPLCKLFLTALLLIFVLVECAELVSNKGASAAAVARCC
jgi:hypothetical protein